MNMTKVIFVSVVFFISLSTDVNSFRLYTGPNNPRNLDADYWIETLGLIGNIEGGYYREIYRSDENINDLPDRFGNGSRSFSTAIYYLLKDDDFSAFHVLKADELWHFYHGKPLSIFLINNETGELETVHLGPREDQHFVYLVPRGRIFAARLKRPRPGDYTLVGTTVSPGFQYTDFALIERTSLLERFPQHQDLIYQLTRLET